METFTDPKKLVLNPYFEAQRRKALGALVDAMIDTPIVDIIRRVNQLPFCFTLQSCYGHFLYHDQTDRHNLDPLPSKAIDTQVEYRIAYVALCIANNSSGRGLCEQLTEITAIDPQNIQFGCAEWFWKRQINSYALQVEPHRFKHQDTAILDFEEALHIEKVRNRIFARLKGLFENR